MAFAASDLVNLVGVPLASFHAYTLAAAHDVELKNYLEDFDRNQVDRHRSGASKARLSILLLRDQQ